MVEHTGSGSGSSTRRTLGVCTVPLLMAISLLLSITASIAVCVSDMSSRYLSENLASAALTVLIITSLILPISAPIIFKGKKAADPQIWARDFSFIPGGAALCTAVYGILFGFDVPWELAIILLSVISAISYIIKPFDIFGFSKLPISLGTVGMGIAIIALLYFDFKVELNSPYKLAVQFGAAALILCAISDIRLGMGRISHGWLILLKSISLSLTLLSSSLVITAFARGSAVLPMSYLVFAVMFAANALSISAELISISFDNARS